MFIQVIQGTCTRQDELHALLDEWKSDQAPSADGWLGGTYGFTDDDQFVGVVRFASREAAMANSDRPEQGEWAERMMALFDGPVEFHDCDDVTMFLDGDASQGEFVQVIQGKVDDPSRLKAMLADTDALHEARPDIVGGCLAIEDDGTFTEYVTFTDEASAREGERHEPPADVRAELDYAMQGARFYDLRRPWFENA
jgi:hypothetical protein